MDFEPILAKIRDQILAIESSWLFKKDAQGCRYLFIPAPYDQFYLAVAYQAGSRYETEEYAGISHLLEHMMFRGSERFPKFIDLAKAFEAYGGEWNAETGQEFTNYWYFGASLGHQEVLQLFKEFLDTPKLADLEREKSIVLREIDEELNEHGDFVDLDYHIASIFWPRTSMAFPITGTHDSVCNITLRDLLGFKAKHYRAETAFITLISPPDLGLVDRIMPFLKAEKSANEIPSLTPLGKFSGPKLKIVENTDGQCSVQIAFLCQDPEDMVRPEKLELLSMILTSGFTSRLSYKIREKLGLVYDIGSNVHESHDFCYLTIEANVNYDLLQKFFEAVFELLEKFKKDGPTEREVSLAKLKYASSLLHSIHSPTGAVDLAYTLYGAQKNPTTIAGFSQRIISVTQSDLKKTLSHLLEWENLAIAVLGEAEKLKISQMQKLIPGLSVSYSISSSPQ